MELAWSPEDAVAAEAVGHKKRQCLGLDAASSSTEVDRKRRWGSRGASWSPLQPRLAIPPIPPERFYGLEDKGEDQNTRDAEWQRRLAALRQPVGDTYVEFPRQEMAFRYVDGKPGEGLHIFAKERQKEGESGLRTYIVTTYKEFWARYTQISATERNYYEVIREGMCCNLYFDIEFLKVENQHIIAGHHEEQLMKAFMNLIGREVQLFFSLPFRVRRRHFVDLDSSDDRKFSRHLILRLPDNYAFISNAHCGHFVRMVHHKLILLRQLHQREKKKLQESRDEEGEVGNDHNVHTTGGMVTKDRNGISGEMLELLFVKNDKGKEVFIVDMGVYTRNRNFRLIYSTKMGKRIYLQPSLINQYTPPALRAPTIPAAERADPASGHDNSGPPATPQLFFEWLLSSLVTRIGESKETDTKKAYLLSCEPVPSEDGRSVLFYAHHLTPTTLPPNLIPGIFSVPTAATVSSTSPAGSASSLTLPTLTFSPPPASSVPSMPVPPLPRVTPECSPYADTSPMATRSSWPGLYSPPSLGSPYQPSLPYYALPPSCRTDPHGPSSAPSAVGSGFPAIDEFVLAHVGGERPGRRGGIRSVRRWGATIVYSITQNRYCENIGREHKSNHIMIVVDLRSGTYYQKCYDPDCQALDYRSPEYALPPDICPTVFTLPNSRTQTVGYCDGSRRGSIVKEAERDLEPESFLSDELLYECIEKYPSLWP